MTYKEDPELKAILDLSYNDFNFKLNDLDEDQLSNLLYMEMELYGREYRIKRIHQVFSKARSKNELNKLLTTKNNAKDKNSSDN